MPHAQPFAYTTFPLDPNYPIEAPDPLEAIKIRMEELHLKQVDLADAIGEKVEYLRF